MSNTMPRTARLTVIGVPHLVIQRSLDNRAVFSRKADTGVYLDLLREKSSQFKLDVLAYCLMRDSVYMVVIPRRRDSLTKGVGRTHFSYTHYFNQTRDEDGHIWRGRFQSCPLDDDYVWLAVKFVETQPLLEGKVRKAEKYPHSSAAAHVNGRDETEVLALNVWPPKGWTKKRWSKFLADKPDEEECDMLLTYAQTGRPLGSDKFVTKLEKKFRRRLHALPVGRPPGT